MSDQSGGPGGNSAPGIDNPASNSVINWLGIGCLLVAMLLIYTLIASWPVIQEETVDGKIVKSYKAWHFFFLIAESWDVEKRMLLTIVLAGAIGSLVHALTSFADFVGNHRFSASWVWWYLLRLPVGSALAIFFYFIIRGGLIVPTLGGGTSDWQQATLSLNPYSMAAFAALAGMFAKNASDKLAEVFDTVMSRKEPVKRANPLQDGSGLRTEPEKLTRGKPETLTIFGKGFKQETEVKINGVKRDTTGVTDTQLKVAIAAKDVEKAGKLELSVKNPNENELKKTIDIVEPAAAKPVISATDPVSLTKGTTPAPALTVKGSGFQPKCTATVNGASRTVSDVKDVELKVALTDADVKDTAKLTLVVANPDGGTSDSREVEVK